MVVTDPVVTGAALSAAPIDPFSPLVDGAYRDDLVTVTAGGRGARTTGEIVVHTRHFEVRRDSRRLLVRHRVPLERIDDALTTIVDEELFGPGWLTGNETFERIFTGVVLSSRPTAMQAWLRFYRNSLRRYLADPVAERRDAVDDFAEIHRYAEAFVPREASVLELGCCFGFLSLRLARSPGRTVIASDLSAGTVRLLGAVAARLGLRLQTMVADAARIPCPDRSVDVVLLIHLLEHLDAEHCGRAIDEALRVADRRVVIAVPYEDEPNPAYGHLWTLREADLRAWAATAPGWTSSVHEHLGGWLVLDRS